MLNAYWWDEWVDLELPEFFQTSKQQSLHDLPFLLFAIISALHQGTHVPSACASRAVRICKLLNFTQVKSSKVDNSRDWSQRIPTFRAKDLRQRKKRVLRRHVKKRLQTLEFFEISHGSYQPLNFSPYLSLSTQYSILISLIQFHSTVFMVLSNHNVWLNRCFLVRCC